MTKSLYITITLCLLLAPKLGLSSEVEFYGKVRDQKTNKALEQSVLEIKLEDGLYKKIECGKNGRFDIDLEFNLRYDVYFICKGYETKWIVLDLRRVPAEDQEGGFKFPVEISLFKKRKNFDNSCLEKPIGILRYSSEKNVLDWDFNHTSRLAVELDKANLLADSLNLSKFEKLVKKGDLAAEKGKKKKAKKFYKKAGLLIPDSFIIDEKLDALIVKKPVRSGGVKV